MPTPILIQADARHIPLPANSVHCVVTSPPYWGLRDYGLGTQDGTPLGLEPVPDCLGWATGAPCGQCYICRMVEIFREVRRVLRSDGTLWLNLGDSYANDGKWGGTTGGKHVSALHGQPVGRMRRKSGLKPKDMVGIPWRVALALQADGWWLRSDIVWQKLAPMPESVTDRPTRAHEFIFLLAKSPRYYYDADAVREPHTALGRPPGNKSRLFLDRDPQHHTGEKRRPGQENSFHPNGRNARDVWPLGPSPYPGAHFATFPLELPRRAILAGTSARGVCSICGAPWRRLVDRRFVPQADVRDSSKLRKAGNKGLDASNGWAETPRGTITSATTGWAPTCTCDAGDPIPATVLDPFCGSGTTLLAARALGRLGIGLDLSANYLAQARRRLDLHRLAAWHGQPAAAPAPDDLTDCPIFSLP